MNRKNILITGGMGFIGINFINYTIKNIKDIGKIIILDKLTYASNKKSLKKEIKKFVKLVIGDISNIILVEKLVKKCDIVINFAAETHNDNSLFNSWPFLKTNIIGTYILIQACKKFNVRYHHISTDEVYGDLLLDNKKKFNLNSPYNPSSPYSSTKASSDLLVKAWIRSFGLKATISNCSNNYGPYQNVEKFIPRQITNILIDKKPKLYGKGNNIRDWIYTEDHCEAIWLILKFGKIGETYLIGTNCELNNKNVLMLILKLMKKPLNFYEIIEDRPGHDLRYAIDSSKLKKELNWKPKKIDFKSNLKKVIKWYINNKSWWLKSKQQVELKYKKMKFFNKK